MAGPKAEDITEIGDGYGVAHLANAPIGGYHITGIQSVVENVTDVDGVVTQRVVIKAYGIRPAQKGQQSLSIDGTEEVADPTPVCLGELLVLDAVAADAFADVLILTAGTI